MFRLNISRVDNDTMRIRHKPTKSCKLVSVFGGSGKGKAEEMAYMLAKQSNCLMRDLLYGLYGDNWREQLTKHKVSIDKSITSAVKRAH